MKQNKNPAMLVLGIVAVIAVMSLVLMFAQNNEAAGAYGAKVYGGGAKEFYGAAGYGATGYFAPYAQGGTFQQECVPHPKGGMICQTFQAAVGKGTTDPRSLREIPTKDETEGMLGPIPIQEATQMHAQGEHIVYNPNLGGYFYKPSEHKGTLDTMI